MGNKASKPARKLAGTIANSGSVQKTTQAKVKLPSAELKNRFENQGQEPSNDSQSSSGQTQPTQTELESPGKGQNDVLDPSIPEGKDGMDPQADAAFIRSINDLGRQIHSQAGSTPQSVNVEALKQLLNRKQLYKKGQDEVKAQLDASTSSRTMIHPRTLTGIIYALNDSRVTRDDIVKDYSIEPAVLENLDRFRVAENLVVIEEDTKEGEIGPKTGQPMARAATEPSLMDYDGTVSESVNSERLKELKRRLE